MTATTIAAASGYRNVPGGGRAAASTVAGARGGRLMAAIARLREFAPYAAIELIVPGGSLIAIVLWLYRRRRLNPA
jgi:hypothetical protein